jgi:RNA polymerase sigma-70 factor (ECF subfamily)
MPDSPSDAELVRAAQAGEMPAASVLLEKHRAGMFAVALSILGNVPDAEDVVQDAVLIALRRMGDVRRPEAAGAWLRALARNTARSRLRSQVPLSPLPELRDSAEWADPEKIIDRHALRDWIWRAIGELSPTHRGMVMLRYFSPRTPSYDQLADLFGIPVGTVRSRLNEARGKLAASMDAILDAAHPDSAAAVLASAREAVETLAAAEQGRLAELAAERWAPDIGYFSGRRRVGDAAFLIRGMNADLEAGVHQRFVSAVTSRETTIWEMDLVNPADDPRHCPPAVAWFVSMKDGLVSELRLFHSPSV